MKAAEREKLQDQVMDMILTGYSQRQIAKQLGIALRTVVNYVHARKDETIKEMRESAEEQMAEMEIAKRKRTQKLWTIVLDEKCKPRDRTKAIHLLQQEDIINIKRKQIIGLLPAEAPVVAIQNNNMIEGVTTITDTVRRVFPEMITKFSTNKTKVLNDRKQGSD